jgi:hypothetical protein
MISKAHASSKPSPLSIYAGCSVLATLLLPVTASATQAHGAPEGLYAHQLAHLFFICSMGVLIFWLRQRRLVREKGWRYLQYSALFFIIWNLDAFAAHLLDEQLSLVRVSKPSLWRIHIEAVNGSRAVEILYYFSKLDHLLCVPALLFLHAGFRRLLKSGGSGVSDDGAAP